MEEEEEEAAAERKRMVGSRTVGVGRMGGRELRRVRLRRRVGFRELVGRGGAEVLVIGLGDGK